MLLGVKPLVPCSAGGELTARFLVGREGLSWIAFHHQSRSKDREVAEPLFAGLVRKWPSEQDNCFEMQYGIKAKGLTGVNLDYSSALGWLL